MAFLIEQARECAIRAGILLAVGTVWTAAWSMTLDPSRTPTIDPPNAREMAAVSVSTR